MLSAELVDLYIHCRNQLYLHPNVYSSIDSMNKNVGRTKSYRMREGERGASSYERVPSKNNVTLVALGILSEFTNEPILPILKFSTYMFLPAFHLMKEMISRERLLTVDFQRPVFFFNVEISSF